MQRKPGFPVANCSIKMPDGMPVAENPLDDDREQVQRRQQLINFGHTQWGFNNWSWSVTKQDLDFVDFANGKFCAGVCAYVSVIVKSLDIHRENIGYATSLAGNKGSAIHKSRKCAVTNALRETLLSFGGSVATELMELLDANKNDIPIPTSVPNTAPAPNTAPPAPHVPQATPHPTPLPEQPENNQNVPNKEPKNIKPQIRKEEITPVVRPHTGPPLIKNAIQNPPPIAKAHPIPANLPPAANRPVPASAPRPPPPGQHPRPNSNDHKDRPLDSMTDEEARAERKRRQQRAQEEFRLRMNKQNQGSSGNDDKPEMSRAASSFDALLMDIPTQEIEIEQTGGEAHEAGKRRSPGADGAAKRRSVMSRLDILTD